MLFEDEKLVGKINVSPNPFKEKININVVEITAGIVNVSVYNILGVKIDEHVFQHNGGNSNLIIDAKNYPAGVYFLKTEIAGSNLQKPITETIKLIWYD